MSIFRIRANWRGAGTYKPTRTSKAINLLLILLVLGSTVVVPLFQAKLVAGPPNININPDAPEGIKQGGQKVAGFIFWLAWLLIFIVGAVGVILMLVGKRQLGLMVIGLAIIGAIIVANWTGVVNWFG